MRTITQLTFLAVIFTFAISIKSFSQDKVQALKDLFQTQKDNASNVFFQRHYQGLLDVINGMGTLTATEESLLSTTYDAFSNDNLGLIDEASYMDRKFPLILAWVSPTDGNVSYTRVRLPKDWDPTKEYPLYLQLHGLWNVAASAIDFMTYPFRNNAATSYAYEDGYVLDPWGRGNLWYKGISETDIWESIEAFKEIAKIDPKRMYLTGHSMGGFGTWYIASKSVGTWAAIGLHAAALQYDNSLLSDDIIQGFTKLPIYFVCGNNDGLLYINDETYNKLVKAGIENVEFATFSGGHDYIQANVEKMYDWIHNFQNENPTSIAAVHNFQLKTSFNRKDNSLNFYVQLKKESRIALTVFDITGKKISSNDKMGTSANLINFQINTLGLKSGIYLFRIKTTDDQITGKFVIN